MLLKTKEKIVSQDGEYNRGVGSKDEVYCRKDRKKTFLTPI